MRLAVIPARGGSRRIPRKNIRIFAGRPIIAYSIAAALQSGMFDRVVVSTDDEEIAKVAVAHGAEAPFMRPASLADDYTGTNAVVKHALGWMAEHGCRVEHACCIYATAPFVRALDLRAGYARLRDTGKSFAFAVTSFPFPIQRAIRITPAGTVEPVFPQYAGSRSQDLEEAYHDAGQFYWGEATAFLGDVELFSAASVPVLVPRHRVQDIDTLEDWERAELLYQVMQIEETRRHA